MSHHERVRLTVLRASDQPRPLITEAVDKLASSMGDVGLIQPITVRPMTVINGIAEPGFQIVAGHHRVAAARALGWVDIDAFVIDEASDHLHAELIEIDENLCRSELTPAQRAAAIKRRKQIWEAMHPTPPSESGRTPPTLTGRGNKAFAADTATASGESKRRINEHLARATAVEEAGSSIADLAGTSLDKGTELDALARLPTDQRKALIKQAKDGKKVSAKEQKVQVVVDRDSCVASAAKTDFFTVRDLRAIRTLSDEVLIEFLRCLAWAGVDAAKDLLTSEQLAA